MDFRKRARPWLARAVAGLWYAALACVLHYIATPWRVLGGLIGERLRWSGWFALLAGAVVGFAACRVVRALAPIPMPRVLRYLLYPPAVITAAASAWLNLDGMNDVAHVISGAFVAYGAGVAACCADRVVSVVGPDREGGDADTS